MSMEITIWPGGSVFAKAVEKYGHNFVEAVVSRECQMHADDFDGFEEYAEMEEFKGFLA